MAFRWASVIIIRTKDCQRQTPGNSISPSGTKETEGISQTSHHLSFGGRDPSHLSNTHSEERDSTNLTKKMTQILHEKSGFPVSVNVIAGRTLSKRNDWWKAMLLVDSALGGTKRPQLRLYAWQYSKKKEGWKQRQKFNFSGISYMPEIITALETFSGTSRRRGEKAGMEFLAKRVAQLQKELEEARISYSKNRIPELEIKVKQFEKLLDKKHTDEKTIQGFLHKEYWMLGARYRRIHREMWAGLKGRNDFILEKESGFSDVLELKLPTDELFTLGRKPRMSGALKDALSQMAEYLHYYHVNYLSHKEQTNMDVLYPKGIIVIGRRKENEKQLLESHNAILSKITILTYDDVIGEARQVIKTLKKRRKNVDVKR